MEQTKINHSSWITAIENFVEDTITGQRPWDDYWCDLVDLSESYKSNIIQT